MKEQRTFIFEESEPLRLDAYLAEVMDTVSRSKIKAWCKGGLVLVDGHRRKGSFSVGAGNRIQVTIPDEKVPDTIVPENIPLDIVYEDEQIVIIDKPVGLVVHPGAGIHSGTLVHALAYHFEHLAWRGGALRPGIVHRLDKGTSGLILVAKTDEAHHHLSRQWQEGEVTKVYQALVWGIPDPESGEIKTHIGRHPKYRQIMAAETPGGRFAHTRYKTVETWTEASKLNVHILTGRTHQVRVHLAHLGHPVVGDAMYGKNRHKNLLPTFAPMPERPMLHAALLRFIHPTSGQPLTFKQAPPKDFLDCTQALAHWPF